MAESGRRGVYNAAGPGRPLTMGGLLEGCRVAGASDILLVWVNDLFLKRHGVAPFSDLPLWLPRSLRGLLALDVDRAIDAGLPCRTVERTFADTRSWIGTEAAAARPSRLASGASTRAGLDPIRERNLLAAWRDESRRRVRDSL